MLDLGSSAEMRESSSLSLCTGRSSTGEKIGRLVRWRNRIDAALAWGRGERNSYRFESCPDYEEVTTIIGLKWIREIAFRKQTQIDAQKRCW
jgi:hypothetical protein